MEDLIKIQLNSLSKQREDLIYEVKNIDYNTINYGMVLSELKFAITDIDIRIDSMLNRLPTVTVRNYEEEKE